MKGRNNDISDGKKRKKTKQLLGDLRNGKDIGN
jgi:hypothetical protein